MKYYRRPALREDEGGWDFPDIGYSTDYSALGESKVRVTNKLTGFPESHSRFRRSIETGGAAWVTEVRSPATLYSVSRAFSLMEYEVEWNPDDVGKDVYLNTRLTARKQVMLPTEIMHEVWKEGDNRETTYPTGSVLARGEIRSFRNTTRSLLDFVPDENLRPGEVSLDGPDQDASFVVRVHPDLFDDRDNRADFWRAALVGAMSRLARYSEETQEDEPPVLRSVRAKLAAKDVDDWTSENYDPLAAASALEPFPNRIDYNGEEAS